MLAIALHQATSINASVILALSEAESRDPELQAGLLPWIPVLRCAKPQDDERRHFRATHFAS